MLLFSVKNNEKGSAEFKKRFRKLGFNGENIVIGKARRGDIAFKPARHLTSIERTRGGKGASLIVPNLLNYEGSVVVVDPKGENAFLTAARRRELGQRVIILDPWGELKRRYRVDEHLAQYNPLGKLDVNSVNYDDDLSYIAEALIVIRGPDKHWDEYARIFVSGLIDLIVRCGDNITLYNLRNLLCLPDDHLVKYLVRYLPVMPDDSFASRRLQQFLTPGKENSSIISAARRQTEILDSGILSLNMMSSSFDFNAFSANNVSLFIILPVDKLVTYGRWLRLIINAAIRAVSMIDKRLSPKPLFVFDEFGTVGPMRIVEQSAGLMAGLNICMWLFLQDLNQLKRDYPDSWQSFLGNSEAITVGPSMDLATAKYFSDMLGNQTIKISSFSRSRSPGHLGATVGKNSSYDARQLISHDEIRHLKDDEGLVLSSNFDARYKKIFYFKNKHLRGMARQDPYYS